MFLQQLVLSEVEVSNAKTVTTHYLSGSNNKKYFYHDNNNYFCIGNNRNCNAEHR